MFKVGDTVVYPAHGVSEVEAIETREISGNKISFFILKVLDTQMTVMVPVTNVENVGIRELIDKKGIDKVLGITAFGMISLPGFAVALILTYWLGVKLQWVPTQGYVRPTEDLVGHFQSVVVPVIALSLGQIAVYMRLLRSDLVATLQEDFILMAKSKGVSNQRVLWRHALRPSSLTILTVAGLNIGTLIGGTVVVESLLGLPGLGYMLGEAVLARQYVALQSLVALVAITFVLINFAVDALYTVLDPRIRERRT